MILNRARLSGSATSTGQISNQVRHRFLPNEQRDGSQPTHARKSQPSSAPPLNGPDTAPSAQSESGREATTRRPICASSGMEDIGRTPCSFSHQDLSLAGKAQKNAASRRCPVRRCGSVERQAKITVCQGATMRFVEREPARGRQAASSKRMGMRQPQSFQSVRR
jgi:hypothetical protein